jgi:hypothetical protein
VSHSEFVAFGCRGAQDKQDFAGFNLRGDEMWQQNFFEAYVSPWFSFAPAAGRFALGRVIVSSPADPGIPLTPDEVRAEEVRVYQTYSGKMLLRVECSPVERAGQNFELSPDGLRLAAVRETVVQHPATKEDEAYAVRTAAIEIYALPPLSAKDEAALRDEQSLAPEQTDAAIRLSTRPAHSAGGEGRGNGGASAGDSDPDAPGASPAADAPSAAGTPAPATAATATTSQATSGTPAPAEGDAPPAAPRKPPSLYGPGETPEKPPQ